MMWPFSRPAKPEVETKTRTERADRVAVTLEYRNGETERVECYGWEYGGGYVALYMPPYPQPYHSNGEVSIRYRKRHISEEVLARDPVETRIGLDDITAEWVVDHEWMRENTLRKSWRPYVRDAEVSVEAVEDSDD